MEYAIIVERMTSKTRKKRAGFVGELLFFTDKHPSIASFTGNIMIGNVKYNATLKAILTKVAQNFPNRFKVIGAHVDDPNATKPAVPNVAINNVIPAITFFSSAGKPSRSLQLDSRGNISATPSNAYIETPTTKTIFEKSTAATDS
mmetsp:Transcript_56900/g.66510  ORF Transcript_56900/g.66510 Transcript_56900/m.66510 type:complete len:146 (+) Transcript_56900:755-1192(+)